MEGSLYTWKLAVHYFRKQPENEERDRCFIITGSMTAYIDSPVRISSRKTIVSILGNKLLSHTQGNWEYTSSKYGLRGFMKTVRRNSWEQGIRINYVAPCWIKSAIRTKAYETWLKEQGIEFGEQADCAGAMMKIACDKSINGAYNAISLTRRCYRRARYQRSHALDSIVTTLTLLSCLITG